MSDDHAPPAPPDFTDAELAAIPAVLSAARFGTYVRAAGGDRTKALRLYAWSARVSAAFGPPLHLAEIAVRNAVAEAVEHAYGTRDWHESQTFASDLRDPANGYSPRQNLREARAEAEKQIRAAMTREYRAAELQARRARRPPPPPPPANPVVIPVGKVIAELRFVFWVSLLTSGHQGRIWDDHLATAFPRLPGADGSPMQVAAARQVLHDEVDAIRKFRNRVAHHEPLLRARLDDELRRLVRVVGWRCPVTAAWLERQQEVNRLLVTRP